MLDKIKKELRITNSEFNEEITDLINACIADLEDVNVKATKTDPLIIRAVAIYCKAHFGFDNSDRDSFLASYEALKTHLSLSQKYQGE